MPATDITTERANCFIKAAEIWLPDDGVLTLAMADHGSAHGFADVTARTTFAKAEGLPGKAWEQGSPIVLTDLNAANFVRHEAAREAGMTCAIAVPIFAGNALKAVLVIFCGDGEKAVGAIELWGERDARLRLEAGYYGSATDFESVSQDVVFARGHGLPGGVWSADMPVLMREIGTSHAFVRSEVAQQAGLDTGLGIPLTGPGGENRVVTLLSGGDTPLARRFEIWDAREERVGPHRRAVRLDGICEREGPLWPKQNPPVDIVTINAWQGPVGQVLGTGVPHIVNDGVGLPAGYRSMVALPVYRAETLAFITAWYL
ncbi:GAF domain-containing protein [Croceicoccus hydrothermalis]|uniref:GAF domain-containing protein n=1 Tax=Croceicoccus hydrothermalis TaxID=2867964 RepID=UPI001EFAA4A6|nr:GAF domain-containing protein [Croceicoccus hydrothermalis]